MARELIWFGFLMGSALYAQTPATQPVQPVQANLQSDAQSFRFDHIRIPIWTQMAKSELEANDFQLFIDGKPAHIEGFYPVWDRPLELVYLIDVSGSMDLGGKLEGSLKAMDYLLARHRSEDRWRIVVFSDGQVVTALDNRHPEAWPELRSRLRAYGKTAFFDALAMTDQFFKPDSLANRAVLAFTDGNDNQSQIDEARLHAILKSIQTPVFIIGIANGFVPVSKASQEKLGLNTMEEITRISGGQLFIAKDVTELPRIAQGLSAKLRPRYMITITVERGVSEKRHQIDVRLRSGRAAGLRHRNGYIGYEPQFIGGKQ